PGIFFFVYVFPMKRDCDYPAANIEDSIKSKIARLYIIQKAKGKSRKESTSELREAGFAFREQQLGLWVLLINSRQESSSPEKLTGSSAALTKSQRDVTSGWILDRNDDGELCIWTPSASSFSTILRLVFIQ